MALKRWIGGWKLPLSRSQLRQLHLIISPRTLLRWHASPVQRRWGYPRRTPGRPRIAAAAWELLGVDPDEVDTYFAAVNAGLIVAETRVGLATT